MNEPRPLTDAQCEQLRALMRGSQKIEAIKLYRELIPGAGLAEAKDAVERLACGEMPLHHSGAASPAAPELPENVEAQVLAHLRAGHKIAAIKCHREASGLGLKDAKEAVEALAARAGIPQSKSGCFAVMVASFGIAFGLWMVRLYLS